MDGNPFMALAGMMSGQNADGMKMVIGAVVKAQPLTISAAGLNLSGEALRVSAELTSSRSGTISGTGYGSAGSVTVSGSCELPMPLKEGDSVLMLTLDNQKFYVICKVVST